MDFRAPGLLDQWLEPPEEVFSAGAFLELGPPCPHAAAPGTPEQGLPELREWLWHQDVIQVHLFWIVRDTD